jgi:hypothetical protein
VKIHKHPLASTGSPCIFHSIHGLISFQPYEPIKCHLKRPEKFATTRFTCCIQPAILEHLLCLKQTYTLKSNMGPHYMANLEIDPAISNKNQFPTLIFMDIQIYSLIFKDFHMFHKFPRYKPLISAIFFFTAAGDSRFVRPQWRFTSQRPKELVLWAKLGVKQTLMQRYVYIYNGIFHGLSNQLNLLYEQKWGLIHL